MHGVQKDKEKAEIGTRVYYTPPKIICHLVATRTNLEENSPLSAKMVTKAPKGR
jgi:hypothetical protein